MISCRTPLRSRFTHEAYSGRSRSTALTTALMSRRPRATRPAGPFVYLNLREPSERDVREEPRQAFASPIVARLTLMTEEGRPTGIRYEDAMHAAKHGGDVDFEGRQVRVVSLSPRRGC